METNADASKGFWIVLLGSDTPQEEGVNFQNITLRGKDSVLLLYVRDEDGDGLYGTEEQHYRTDDDTETDTDGDGLDDVDEIRGGIFIDEEGNEIPCGWVVETSSGPDPEDRISYYPVVSDPTHKDADGDGLEDDEEYNNGTDPNPTRSMPWLPLLLED